MKIINRISLRKNTIIFGLRQIILFVLGFLVNIYITKYLAPKDFGILVIFNTFISALGIVSDGGIFISFIQSKDNIDTKTVNKMVSFQIIVLFLSCMILTILTALNALDMLSTKYVYLAFVITGFNSLQSIFYTKFQKDFNISYIAVSDLISSLFYYIIVIVLIALDYGIISIILATIIKGIVSIVISLSYYKNTIKLDFAILEPSFINKIRIGFINQFSYLVNFLKSLLNPIIVGNILGISEVGLIDRAVSFSGMPVSIVNAIVMKEHPAIKSDVCIGCYCCHELCPQSAWCLES